MSGSSFVTTRNLKAEDGANHHHENKLSTGKVSDRATTTRYAVPAFMTSIEPRFAYPKATGRSHTIFRSSACSFTINVMINIDHQSSAAYLQVRQPPTVGFPLRCLLDALILTDKRTLNLTDPDFVLRHEQGRHLLGRVRRKTRPLLNFAGSSRRSFPGKRQAAPRGGVQEISN